MSPDEAFLVELLRALQESSLEAIIVGSVAGVLQGAPVMTQDVDLLIRDTDGNRRKVAAVCERLGGAQPIEVSPLSRTLRLIGLPVSVDILFDELSGGLGFGSIRSRARRVDLAGVIATVASLEDVIASKEAAGRPKDVAQLPILRDTLRVRQELERGDS